MKKYNLSKIMKRAWELVKKAGLSISKGLKKAWKEAKNITMKGTKKQIAWATVLMDKMHTEFSDCKEIAPVKVHQMFDKIEEILMESYAGDIIDLLKDNDEDGQKYFANFRATLSVSTNAAAMRIKKALK